MRKLFYIKRLLLLTVLMLSSSMAVFAQAKLDITGQVVDTHKEPIIGASILIKGSSKGAMTDYDGKFNLSVKNGDVLVLTYIGYATKEVKVSATKTKYIITMKEDNKSLDELIVIGYGSSRKQDLSTAVSTLKIDKSMKSRPANIGSYLQGQLPGVSIISNGGDPLAGQGLSIRGRGSRGSEGDYNSGDAVLYVVDGVAGAPFNMEDVESITILKDAASAAIYGASVGSGGVVVVTTKQAKSGKVKVHFNASKSFKNAWKLPSVLSAEEYNSVWADASKSAGKAVPACADAKLYPYGAVTRTNWLDAIFRTGSLEHYGLSIAGGSEKIKALASFSYDYDKGILKNTYSRQFGSKFNLDFNLAKWITFRETLTFKYSNGQGSIKTGHEGVLSSAVLFTPSATLYDYKKNGEVYQDRYGNKLYHGTLPRWAVEEGIGSTYGEIRNPLAMLERLDQDRPSTTVYSTSSVELKPLRNLKVKSDFTIGLDNNKMDVFYARVPEIGRPDMENSRSIFNHSHNRWLWETTATYSDIFADKHHISAMAGYTMKYDKDQYTQFSMADFDREDRNHTVLNLAHKYGKQAPREGIWEESMLSGFGRLAYSFDDRYFFTASLRYDATSKLWHKNNSGVFPALSASWKISSEDFFADMKEYINLFKIRGSWGQVGNVNLVPRYSWNVPLASTEDGIYYGKDLNNRVVGIYAQSIGVKDLTWETTEQTGLGLDLAILNNTFTLSVDYFNKKTKDLIERVPVASVAGVKIEPYGNVGEVVNKGWEFSAAFNKRFGDLDVKVFGNLTTIHNEVLDLGARDFIQHSNTINSIQPLRSGVGQPWYSYYLLKTDGIFQSDEEAQSYKWTDPKSGISKPIQGNAKAGDLKYVDTNNDGQINSDDYQYLGSYMPKITYGFGANLAYKGFDFSMLFQGVGETMIYNGFKQIGLTGRQQGGNMLSDIKKSWNYDKTSGIPRLALINDDNGNYSNPSDFYLEDGSYLRLKNLTFGYTLPKSVMQSIGLKKGDFRLFFSAENLATFTNYTGFDPEVGNFGIDAGIYPVARSFSLGLNFNF